MRLPFRTLWIALPALVLLGTQVQAQESKLPAIGRIERLDPRFDSIVPRDARVERIGEGFNWSEGPVWFPDEGGYLLFSDVPENTVFKWTKADGVKEFLKPSGYTGSVGRSGEPGSNGLLRDPDGNLVLMQHGDRRVARLEGGKFVTIADRYQGKRFNSPNDGVFKSNGDLYFTDPPYGLVKGEDDPARELDFQGVYRVSKDGVVTLLTKELSRPNGIGFSPDESTLYVANSDPERAVWMAYSVKEDGTLGPGRVFFDATKWTRTKKGLPDGLTIDAHGNIFATGPGGVLVFAPDGTHLGTFDTGEATGNCAFGGDGSALFITADMYLGRVRLKTRGKGF
ncbi:MAG TPA: SMP-30/gluconolactonase/LRE family protein [Isosphaeraceae bacterium]|nr:SMP-30/gluconolactonase/LRE family protein [Isosphaeraceae bacterium]